MRRIVFAALLLIGGIGQCFATDQGQVVTSCPGSQGYTAGQFGNITIDVNGNVCVSGTSSITGALPAGTNTIGNVGNTSQYPTGAIPITASATGTTAATTATLAASTLIKTYICGFSIRANATAAATGNATVTSTITGTLNFTQWTAPAATGIGLAEERFTPCVPSSAINTGIAVISAAPGSGGVVSVTAWGYQL